MDVAEPAQIAEGKFERESATLPGHCAGIYSCKYKNLSTIYLHTAAARLAVVDDDMPAAEVSVDILPFHQSACLLAFFSLCLVITSSDVQNKDLLQGTSPFLENIYSKLLSAITHLMHA